MFVLLLVFSVISPSPVDGWVPGCIPRLPSFIFLGLRRRFFACGRCSVDLATMGGLGESGGGEAELMDQEKQVKRRVQSQGKASR